MQEINIKTYQKKKKTKRENIKKADIIIRLKKRNKKNNTKRIPKKISPGKKVSI